MLDALEAPRRRPEGSDAKSRSAMGRTHRREAAHGAQPAALHLPLSAQPCSSVRALWQGGTSGRAALQADGRHQGGSLGGFERCRVDTCWPHWLCVATRSDAPTLRSQCSLVRSRQSGGAYAASTGTQTRKRSHFRASSILSTEPRHRPRLMRIGRARRGQGSKAHRWQGADGGYHLKVHWPGAVRRV